MVLHRKDTKNYQKKVTKFQITLKIASIGSREKDMKKCNFKNEKKL